MQHIKIQYGFKITRHTFKELNSMMNRFRDSMKITSQKLLNQRVANKMSFHYDMKTINNNHIKSKSISEYTFDTMLRDFDTSTKEQLVDPVVDYGFSVVLFPDGSSFYGIVYTSQAELYKEFMKHPSISYFGYDSVNKPKDISDTEWKTREHIWNKLLLSKNPAIPELHGMSYTIISENFMINNYPDDKGLYEYIGNLDSRATEISREVLYERFMKEKSKKDDMVSTYNKFIEYSKTKQGTEDLESIKDSIKKKLKLVITNFDDLGGKIITGNIVNIRGN